MYFLGAIAQIPEWACQWTLDWARAELFEWHYIPEWHSECNTIPIGKPIRQPLTKAVVQRSIKNLNVFKSFELMLAPPSTLLSNAMKFACIHARSFWTVVLKAGEFKGQAGETTQMLSEKINGLLIQRRGDLRLYLTKMSPNISKLCEGRQAHPSHWTEDHGMYRFL